MKTIIAGLLMVVLAARALAGPDARAVRERLVSAGWSAPVAERIAQKLTSARKRVVAVFDHDGTLMHGDITMGCGVQPGLLREMVRARRLKPAGLAQIPAWMEPDPWSAYERWTGREPMRAYGWLPTVLAGFGVEELKAFAARQYRDCYRRYLFPEMLALLGVLREAGTDVYIVSASAQPILEAASPYLGIPGERIFGIRMKAADGVYRSEIEWPPSYAAGKVWYIQRYVKPDSLANLLTFGDSYVSDGPMLRLAQRSGGVGVLINPAPAVMPKVERDGLLHQTFPSERTFPR